MTEELNPTVWMDNVYLWSASVESIDDALHEMAVAESKIRTAKADYYGLTEESVYVRPLERDRVTLYGKAIYREVG